MTSGISYEIILIDNASTDGSIEVFSKLKHIILVSNKSNLGFAKANNIGLGYTKGKYIFLLNSDTILLNNAVKLFFDYAEAMDNNIACLGCQLLDETGAYSFSYGTFLNTKDVLLSSLKSYLKFIKLNSIKEKKDIYLNNLPSDVNVIIGADLFIRRSIIEEHGFFDPSFFMYHEENDLQRKYFSYGLRSVIINGPKIIHFEGKSTTGNFRKLIIGTNGLFTYLKKWSSLTTYITFRFFYFFLKLPIIFSFSYTAKDKQQYIKLLLSFK
ncbi:glycosyltransferase family 2 protein [Spirosoma horti]